MSVSTPTSNWEASATSVERYREPFADVVELLRRPSTYEERPKSVAMRETHISCVFLTARHAYKLKKPLHLDFLDYSTCQRRHLACLDELRLNQRLAPQIYLGVLPIARDGRGHLRLCGAGRPVDWVVKMRRLPDERSLEGLLKSGGLKHFEADQLASFLTQFYLGLPPVTVRTEEYRARISQHVEANERELSQPQHGLSGELVRRVHSAQRTYLLLSPSQFDERVCDGRVVEGHGDLRPEHVYMHGGPMVIDCIEFNTEFRQLDVLDELSFLTMECAMLGQEAIGQAILDHYCEASGDQPNDSLRNFYSSYRACVRAKVAALRSEQYDQSARAECLARATRYLELADQYATRLQPPLMLIVRGLSGTGKSTLAAALADRFRLQLLQTDAVRRELYPVSAAERHATTPGNEHDPRYQSSNRRKVYCELLRRAEQQLRSHCGVVLDGTFLREQTQREAIEIGKRCGACTCFIDCHCPDEVARRRITQRLGSGTSLSDATPELLERQHSERQSPPPDSPTCSLDTTASVSELLQRVTSHLQRETARTGC